jgi:thiamine-phosphate pyrophosphorylase
MHPRILRTIDANINRISEGLRVLEDIARFIIEDTDTCKQLKSIRHDLNLQMHKLGIDLLLSRESNTDIGAHIDLTDEHINLFSLTQANAKRIEQGLRVLEELAKLPDLKNILSTKDIKKARYSIYSLERTLIAELHMIDN